MGSNIYHVLGFLEPYWLLDEAEILAVISKQILSARLFAVCSTILFSSIICLIFNLPFLDRSDFGRGGSRENNGSSDLGSKTNSGAKKIAIVISRASRHFESTAMATEASPLKVRISVLLEKWSTF